jgi:hypothetical protein
MGLHVMMRHDGMRNVWRAMAMEDERWVMAMSDARCEKANYNESSFLDNDDGTIYNTT